MLEPKPESIIACPSEPSHQQLPSPQIPPPQMQMGGMFLAGLSQELLQSLPYEQRCNILIAAIPDLLLWISRDGVYLDVHESSQVRMIMPAAELIGKTVLEVLPPVTAHEQMLYIQRALVTQQLQVLNQQLVIHGDLRHQEVRVVPISENVVVLIVRDMTDRYRAEQHLRLQHAVTQVLAESTTSLEGTILEGTIPKLLQTICEQLEWQLGEFWLVDDRAQMLRRTASWHTPVDGLTTFVHAGQGYRFAKGTGFAGKVWASGTPYWLSDIDGSDSFLRSSLAVRAGLRGAMGIPIASTEGVLGILVLFTVEVRQYDAALVETMQTIGRQIGQFIDRQRIVRENQRQNQLTQLLALTTLRIRESLDLRDILNITVAEARQFLDTQRVVVYQFSPGWGGKVLVESVAHGWQSILHQDIYDTCFTGVYTQRYQQGRSHAIADVYAERLDPCYLAMLTSMQVRAYLVVPILLGNELWGLLIAHHCAATRAWQSWEINFLEKLAVQAGVGIQQAELYGRLSTELKERRQTEKQLLAALQALEQQKFALDQAAMVTQVDAEGKITYVNDKFCHISQYSRGEVVGQSYRVVLGKEYPPECFQKIVNRVKQGQVWHGEMQNWAKDGSLYWTDTTVVPFLNRDGQPVEYLIIRFDITDRKLVQEQLQAIQKRLQYLLASSPAIIYTRKLNALERVSFISPNSDHLLGWGAHQFIRDANFWRSLLHPDDAPQVLTSLAMLPTTQHLVLEYRLQHQGGDYRWIRDEMRVLTSGVNYSQECIGSMIDVTDRRIAEEQVLQALERERELSELRSRFVCNTSHEFRTPLATIFSASDLLKRFGHKLSDEKKLERLDKIQAEVKHMTRLLEDVLLLGKISAGQVSLKPVSIDFAAFCRDLLQETELVVGQTHRFEFHCRGECHMIVADKTMLKQIVNNLLSNAVKYSPQGGVVTLSLDGQGANQVVLCIQDQGIGIAPQDQERLFEDFFRAGNVGNLPGTGLGLSIVKQAVDAHQGTITVQSKLGLGTTVTVCLPRELASPSEFFSEQTQGDVSP